MSRIKMFKYLFVFATLASSIHAFADPKKVELSISGFFDGYYSYNLNNPKQVPPQSLSSPGAAAGK